MLSLLENYLKTGLPANKEVLSKASWERAPNSTFQSVAPTLLQGLSLIRTYMMGDKAQYETSK